MSSAENDTHTGRLVWISDEKFDLPFMQAILGDAWDAAPADPAEAVWHALRQQVWGGYVTREEHQAVLSALGVPEAPSPTQETERPARPGVSGRYPGWRNDL